jgi:hypothetical protein
VRLISFATDYVRYVLKGSTKFYAWMGFLSVLIVGMMSCSTCRTPRG